MAKAKLICIAEVRKISGGTICILQKLEQTGLEVIMKTFSVIREGRGCAPVVVAYPIQYGSRINLFLK